ncbi:MAG: Wzz/FepE/Etk N-terminal domain-containing protein [Flavobacteriales bacterium]|jgi:tyrosine-protein kinase Etk/Wzc
MNNQQEGLKNASEGLIQFIWINRKKLMLFTFTAAVISGVVAFLMTPLYLSTAVVFPAATSSVSFSEQRNAKAAAMDFGEEEQAEQLVQILQSSRIRDKVVTEFDLMKHYEINENGANKYFKLNEAYNNHISFNRTRFGSIRIDVLDENPALAAKIANKIVDLIDTVKNEMIAERTVPAFKVNERKLAQMKRDRDAILRKLDSLADLGVIALDVRSNLFQAYVDSKNPEDRAELKKKIDVNMKYGAMYDGLEYMRNEKIVKIEDFNISYEQAESDANTKFNHKFIVERAVKADKKEKPKRSVIILVSTLAAFFIGLFSLLLWEKYKELRAS